MGCGVVEVLQTVKEIRGNEGGESDSICRVVVVDETVKEFCQMKLGKC